MPLVQPDEQPSTEPDTGDKHGDGSSRTCSRRVFAPRGRDDAVRKRGADVGTSRRWKIGELGLEPVPVHVN